MTANKGAPKKSAQKKGTEVSRATIRHFRTSPQKARLVVNLIKGKQVEPALQILRFSPKKTARIVEKLIESALSSAREKGGVDVDRLWVLNSWVDSGRTMKRIMARAQGRAFGIKKRSSHISVVLGLRG